jgi:uroporphyrinogen-III synthase
LGLLALEFLQKVAVTSKNAVRVLYQKLEWTETYFSDG